jgi:tryptophan synthase alpha chain
MSERLDKALENMRASGNVGVIPYVTIGFPTLEDTFAIVPALEKAGAIVIELGVPYSDPLGDGPTIQAASHRALQSGMTTAKCIDAAKRIRESGVTVPLLFMGYYNPVLNYGIERYAKDCAAAGVDGFIIPDLPVNEAEPFQKAARAEGLALVPLLAPTSTEERIATGAASADGFVYCVSVAGVTGARTALPETLPEFVSRIRANTELPIAVGFGVTERSHVEAIGKVADAAVVGSALINVIESAPAGERASRAGAFVASLVGTGT